MSQTQDERIARVAFNADGLVAAIVQQWDTREVLMLGWMDAEALRRTLTERSEEHTSELQSRENLVCRLLLEKKNEGVSQSSRITQREQTHRRPARLVPEEVNQI